MKKYTKAKNSIVKNQGITLIALIVTIITMLILAGVSLSVLLGNNGVLNRAGKTKKIYDVTSIKEALEIEKGEIGIDRKEVNLDNYLEQIQNGEKAYDLNSTEKIDDKNAEIIVNDEYKFLIKDKENGDVEIIYEGIAKPGDLALSSSSGIYTYPTSGTFSVINNVSGGAISATSSNESIATVSVDGNIITVIPGTIAGKAIITVKSAAVGEYAENKATYEATVNNGTISVTATPYTGTYDGQAHNAVTVTTTPADAKKEYSTDGKNYSTTMPTVTNVTSYTISVRVSKAGYKTETVTKTVTVNKAAGGLSLSATSGTITYPNTKSITASGNTGTISASSSNTNVATVSVSGNTITITPKNVNGTATITVTSAATTNYNAKSATYSLTVKKGTYSVGESVTVGGKAFYVIGDNGTNVTLLYKSTIGTANWANAKSQASTFGSNLGGTGRLMTKAEASGLSNTIRYVGFEYWLADEQSSGKAWDVKEGGWFNPDYKWCTINVRPVLVISKSKLS